ncbi:MAG TPA: xanthine dehydrogenase family protein molybdopterin-binding subunit [Xanthobacteraceae bacterium]|nr:xanthine dehydrogenase family protein molybdopterin-binding subunit [Xanthobacteraceae bacterium]
MTVAAPEPKANMGQPVPRYEARLKVTGEARFGADVPLNNPAYAFLVTSAIAKGRIAGLDLGEARAVPGVLGILTQDDAAELKQIKFSAGGGGASTSIQKLGPEIFHDGQIIAMVLADSFEAAREAAYRVRVSYAAEAPTATFGSPGTTEDDATKVSERHREVPQAGDAEVALAAAEVLVDAEYGTPTQHHNPLELFCTTCVWSDGQLTIYEPSQFVYGLKNAVAQKLDIAPDKVRVVSPYVGGAFGSRGQMTPRTALVALAARKLNRPVKLVPTRDQGFTIATYRAETRHRVRLGARRDGKLVGYSHDGFEVSSRPDPYVVAGVNESAHLYAFGTVKSHVTIVHADRNTPGFMRSPPVVPYIYALETAMDELAVKLGMDPVELRRINDTATDPIRGKPYSSRSLMQCYDEAARAFGWSRRNPEVGAMRDGDWLIGWGCATAVYPTHVGTATARVRLLADGEVRVQTAAHEIGNGVYTVLAQMASERLGVPLESVQVDVGDSNLPPAPVAGGSNTTASTCSAVLKACDAIREKLLRAASTANDSPLSGRPTSDLRLTDGRAVASDGAQEKLADLMKRLGVGAIEEYAEFVPPGIKPEAIRSLYEGRGALTGGPAGDKMMYALGAEFVELRIHAATREIRVPRMVGAFAAGRIMNPRTTRSQYLGGMIWGIGSALHEATEIDAVRARYVNDNFADYLIPVNADIGDVEIILVPEEDEHVNPAGVKGLGELANVGTAAAVSNAIYHATGRRIRQLPIRIEDLL